MLRMTTTNRTKDPPPRDPRERLAWVKYKLQLRGLSFAELARREGCSQRAVASAMLAPSRFLEEAIAKAIGLAPATLFPERYGANGQRLCRSREPHRTKRTEQDNKDHAAAA